MELAKTRFSDTNRDDIVRYLEAGGNNNTEGLILSDKQMELYHRWQFAAEKIREQKYKREQIAQFIIGAYGVSRDTAYRDIVNAEYVFAASYPLNKQFLIQNRIEFLQKKINDAFIDKDYASAAKLEKELREYIDMYPESKPIRAPKTINFIIQNNLIVTQLTADQAFAEAEVVIKELEGKDEF